MDRVISPPAERSNGYITQSSRASCSKYMGYIKNCNHIIFYSKLLTLCSRISFIEFRQKCVYNSAIHTWYSCPCCPRGNVPSYDAKSNRLSAEPPCLTFKTHSEEPDPARRAASVSAAVLTRWGFAPATPAGPLDYCEVSRVVNGHRVCCRMLTRPYRNYSVCFEEMIGICWKGFHGQPRGQLVLSYSLVTIHHRSLILNQFFFNSL